MIAEYSVTLENKTKSELILFIKELQDMLKEKDKEIEKLRKNNKDLLRKLRNRVKEVKKLQRKDYKSIVTKQGKTLEERAEQLKKKDKIIDLMADRIEWLCKSNGILLDKEHDENFTQKDVKQYFERKSEEWKK